MGTQSYSYSVWKSRVLSDIWQCFGCVDGLVTTPHAPQSNPGRCLWSPCPSTTDPAMSNTRDSLGQVKPLCISLGFPSECPSIFCRYYKRLSAVTQAFVKNCENFPIVPDSEQVQKLTQEFCDQEVKSGKLFFARTQQAVENGTQIWPDDREM